MVDLAIDYENLKNLSTIAHDLAEHMKPNLNRGGGGGRGNKGNGDGAVVRAPLDGSPLSFATREEMGGRAHQNGEGLFEELTRFFQRWAGPFTDAQDQLDKLANVFEKTSDVFFDMDADLAAKIATAVEMQRLEEWKAASAALANFNKLKGQSITRQFYDEHGHLVSDQIPLVTDADKPPDPGPVPTTAFPNPNRFPGTNPDGSPIIVNSNELNPDGTIAKSTNTITGANGQTYTETTTYTYHADEHGNQQVVSTSTQITHADGSSQTIHRDDLPNGGTVTQSTDDQGTTTTVDLPTGGDSHRSVTVDPHGVATTEEVTDNGGGGRDHKTVSGPDGTFQYDGDAGSDTWTQVGFAPPAVPNPAKQPPKDGQPLPGGNHGP